MRAPLPVPKLHGICLQTSGSGSPVEPPKDKTTGKPNRSLQIPGKPNRMFHVPFRLEKVVPLPVHLMSMCQIGRLAMAVFLLASL